LKRILGATLLSLACAAPALAHHGRDFLMIESPEIPHPGDVYFVSSERASRSAFTTEPSVLFGINRRLAAEVHVHVSRDGYEAAAPAIHLQLGERGPWSFGASAEYEIARHRADNAFGARVIAARAIGVGQITFNIANRGGYGIGYRPDMEAHTSWGIEAGREEHGDPHELLFGVYAQPNARFTIKAGAGAGLGQGRPLAVFRTGIVWRF
jgi:hypothetical protein